MPNLQLWQYAAIGVAVLLFTANWWWPWVKGLFVRKTPPTPAVDTLAGLVAARETLRPILPPDVDKAVWQAVGEWRAAP